MFAERLFDLRGVTACPQATSISTTLSPRTAAILDQRSPNLPPFTTMTVSPGRNRPCTAAVMAPVPEQESGSTGCSVPNSFWSMVSVSSRIFLKPGFR